MSESNVVPMRPVQPEPLLRDVIGQTLRREREAQHRTLRGVAEAAGMSMQYLSEVERGRKEASSEVLRAICRALGIQLLDLVGETHHSLIASIPQLPARDLGPTLLLAV